MKKLMFAVIGLSMAGSLSLACPGEGLFQILVGNDDEVAATYDFMTGRMVARNQKFEIYGVVHVLSEEAGEVDYGDFFCDARDKKNRDDCYNLKVSDFEKGKHVQFLVEDQKYSYTSETYKLILGKNSTEAKNLDLPEKVEVKNKLEKLKCAIKIHE